MIFGDEHPFSYFVKTRGSPGCGPWLRGNQNRSSKFDYGNLLLGQVSFCQWINGHPFLQHVSRVRRGNIVNSEAQFGLFWIIPSGTLTWRWMKTICNLCNTIFWGGWTSINPSYGVNSRVPGWTDRHSSHIAIGNHRAFQPAMMSVNPPLSGEIQAKNQIFNRGWKVKQKQRAEFKQEPAEPSTHFTNTNITQNRHVQPLGLSERLKTKIAMTKMEFMFFFVDTYSPIFQPPFQPPFHHQDTLPSGTSSRILGSRRPSASPATSRGLGMPRELRESKDRVTVLGHWSQVSTGEGKNVQSVCIYIVYIYSINL